MGDMIIVHAFLHAAPEHHADYLDGLRALQASTLDKDRGCLAYHCWEDIDEPGQFVCLEQWTDLDSLRAHLDAPHHIAGSAVLDQWRGRPAEVHVYSADPLDIGEL